MLRIILAIFAGYIAMAVLVIVATAVAAKRMLHAPDVRTAMKLTPTPAYLVVNLTCSALAAIVGGFVSAAVAEGSAFTAIRGLAAVMAIMGIISAVGSKGSPRPKWYAPVLMILGIAGVLGGGYLQAASE
ncbi:MAG: hypothetical protein JWM32_1190 [Verrucomicrobia bacterium]|nr:hypothetical protein [Verrucomicrobiota bacterium]